MSQKPFGHCDEPANAGTLYIMCSFLLPSHFISTSYNFRIDPNADLIYSNPYSPLKRGTERVVINVTGQQNAFWYELMSDDSAYDQGGHWFFRLFFLFLEMFLDYFLSLRVRVLLDLLMFDISAAQTLAM